MSEHQRIKAILGVEPSRRSFIAKFAAAVFAAPLVSSFALDGIAQARPEMHKDNPTHQHHGNQTDCKQYLGNQTLHNQSLHNQWLYNQTMHNQCISNQHLHNQHMHNQHMHNQHMHNQHMLTSRAAISSTTTSTATGRRGTSATACRPTIITTGAAGLASPPGRHCRG